MALARKNRLSKKKDIDAVFKEGRVVKDNLIVIRYKNNNSDLTRVGFIIPLKLAKNVVKRNRIKRILSGVISTHIEVFKKGLDILVIVRSIGKEDQLKEELLILINKIYYE